MSQAELMPGANWRFLFIMDPFETLNLETETSLLLMEELLKRQQEVYWTEVGGLALNQATLMVKASQLRSVEPLELGAPEWQPAAHFSALMVRPDPPVNERYLHMTYLLDFVPEHVKQFNPGQALRAFNEKLLPLRWPRLTPTSVTTMNVEALHEFLKSHGEIVIKPLGDCSGRGIKRVSAQQVDAIEELEASVRAPDGSLRFVTAQEFLTEVTAGDKRIYLVDGEPVGAVNRVPKKGGFLGNIHQGAHCEPAQPSASELEAIAELRPFLRDNGLFLVGADFIGGKLTELNITSPSAVRQINQVSTADIHPVIVDALLRRMDEAQR